MLGIKPSLFKRLVFAGRESTRQVNLSCHNDQLARGACKVDLLEVLLDRRPARLGEEFPDLPSLVGRLGDTGIDRD